MQAENRKTTRYISILRGINVGGKRKILMADLRQLFEKLGYSNIITYIQSGNVIFDYERNAEAKKLEDEIQRIISKTYGFDVPVIVRTVDEIKHSISNNPFLDANEIERLHLTFLKEAPDRINLEQINEYSFPTDDFKIIGKEVFIFCSGKYSDSKLTNTFFEKKLKVSATTRNWKTVNKLFEIATKES